jgi:hypothetical protein
LKAGFVPNTRERAKDWVAAADICPTKTPTVEIMSTNRISASSHSNVAAIFATANKPQRHGGGGEDGGRASSGDGTDRGITLLASLLQALTQAVSAAAASVTTASAAGAASNTATSAADATTAAAAATAATGAPRSGTSLAQDLQAFLHDLFHALRDAGRPSHNGGYAIAPRPVTRPSPAGSIRAPLATGNGIATNATNTAGNTGGGTYGQRTIISALHALVQDLSNSQVLSAGSSTASGPAAATGQSTSALQSFLTNFLQGLQNNGATSLSSLGSSVNTTA